MMEQGREDRHPHVIAIVDKIKSEGIFDALRRECLADADTKPAYQNLRQKVENACAIFLSRVAWTPKINKNQLREQMRKNLEDSGVLQSGVKRIVNQVVTPKIDKEVKPKVAQVVCEYLGLDPDDINTGEEDEYEEQTTMNAVHQMNEGPPAVPLSLYPFNPFEPPPPINAPPLPGFENLNKPPASAPPPPPQQTEGGVSNAVQEVRFEEPQPKAEEDASDKQDDMDISEKSDSRSTSRASTKKSMDMDCTMTSDEESGGAVDTTDLSKGLAAYMATNIGDNAKNDDDMSISSSETSSKRGLITPEPSEETKESTAGTSSSKKDSKRSSGAEPAKQVERREMRRQRTRNKKYMSDDFESIFTEKRELLGDTYNQDYVQEEIISTDDMMTQVIVEESVKEEDIQTQQPSTTEFSSFEKTKSSTETDNSSDLHKPRRSSRRRAGTNDTSPSLPSPTPNVDDITSIKLPDSKPETRRPLRSSKSLTSATEDTKTQTPARRRYTRSSAKTRSESDENRSSGSTPTQDEPGEQTSVDINTVLPVSLVVLSDICAGQDKIPTASLINNSLREGSRSPTPTLDERTDDKETEATQGNNLPGGDIDEDPETLTASPVYEQASESYEPELHFDEMSRAVAEQSDLAPRDMTTPTLDEPISPDRLTESPTSPAPSSPTEDVGFVPGVSSSMVTIPLDGDESYHSIVEPLAVPLAHSPIPSECIPEPEVEQPPLPPELPPLPQDPGASEDVLPPPEPCGDDDGEDSVYEVLDEVGEDEESPPPEDIEGDNTPEEGALSDQVEEEDDLEELERLAQRKLEILKAIELPDSMLERSAREPSSEEEGEISDSSGEERSRLKKKKSKKSKKKKSKKESRKRKYHDADAGNSSKRSRHH